MSPHAVRRWGWRAAGADLLQLRNRLPRSVDAVAGLLAVGAVRRGVATDTASFA